VEVASVRDSPRRASHLRLLYLEIRKRPLLALVGGSLLIAVGAGLIAAHVTVFALDETLIEQSAVHYTSDLPHSLFHDLDARATNRLYPLVLSIAFRLFSGASAVRVDHVLSVLLFVSAVVPIFLMARIVLDSVWSAVAVALLSIAVPWLTLTSALFTENLSYPLFWWMMLGTCRAVWRPSPLRDLVALLSMALLVGTRAQFAAVFAGYVLALLAVVLWRADMSAGLRRRLVRAARDIAQSYPLTVAILLVALAVLVHEKLNGQLHRHIVELLGSYSNVVTRSGLPPNMGEGLLIELIALALGVGLLPAIVSLAWFARRMSRPRFDRRWVYLFTCGVVLVVFMILTVYSQGGYLGPVTEERYFFYVIPAFWLGTFAALEDRSVRRGDLLGWAAALAALYATIPFQPGLTEENAFLAPVESIAPHVLSQWLSDLGPAGLTVQDALALLALLAGLLTALLWSRSARVRLWWALGFAAVVQLAMAGYAFAVIDGKVSGIVGRTGGSVAALGWIDSHARSPQVMWLEDLSTAAPPASDVSAAGNAANQQHVTLFWNSRVNTWAEIPALGLPPVEPPMSALPGLPGLTVEPRSGQLAPASAATGLREDVEATHSAFLQLAGTPLARSPDGVLTLTQLSRPVRALWLATGLQPEGAVPAAHVVALAAFTGPSRAPEALSATLTLAPPAPVAGAASPAKALLAVRLGSAQQRVVLTAGGAPVEVSLTTCLAAGQAATTGAIQTLSPPAPGAAISGTLQSVTVTRGPCTSAARSLPHAR
jgi:hypothetical protein